MLETLKNRNIDSIIFDLDGTLWDAVDALTKVYNIVVEEHGGKKLDTEFVRSLMGKTPNEISEIVFPHLDSAKREEIIKQSSGLEGEVIRKYKAGVLFPELESTLEKLAEKFDLFIVSNCQDGYIEAFFDAHGLEKYFKDYENPGRTSLPKSENIKLVVERNNLENPVYVGDIQHDMEASEKAGVEFIYAEYGFGDIEDYNFKIEKFSDLLELL